MVSSIDTQSVYKLSPTAIEGANGFNFKNVPANEKDQKLKESAKDFEAVFVNQFMETINSTVERSDFMSGGQGEDTFRSMLTQEMSKNIASSPTTSFGLAEQIYRQMKDRI
ncbi:MAG: rod-binding protein [bacterium]